MAQPALSREPQVTETWAIVGCLPRADPGGHTAPSALGSRFSVASQDSSLSAAAAQGWPQPEHGPQDSTGPPRTARGSGRPWHLCAPGPQGLPDTCHQGGHLPSSPSPGGGEAAGSSLAALHIEGPVVGPGLALLPWQLSFPPILCSEKPLSKDSALGTKVRASPWP